MGRGKTGISMWMMRRIQNTRGGFTETNWPASRARSSRRLASSFLDHAQLANLVGGNIVGSSKAAGRGASRLKNGNALSQFQQRRRRNRKVGIGTCDYQQRPQRIMQRASKT
jgi:hypothetical protein